MIKKDQPTIFGGTVVTGLSSVGDGNMKKNGFPESEQQAIEANRRTFLSTLNITLEQTVLVSLTYDMPDFTKYKIVTTRESGEGMVKQSSGVSDALVTQQKNVALFLPIADCVGAILYDPVTETLMVSHLGRHSTEQYGGQKSVEYLIEQCGVDPQNLQVWLGPSPGRDSYPMFKFRDRAIIEVVKEQLRAAGVRSENIEASTVDTSSSHDYFSHSEFKKGNRDSDGRFAIVAMVK